MPQSSLMHHLLPLLLHRLEAEGYAFGVDVHLRLHQLLGQLPDDYPPERLQYLLAPLLTKSPAAQQAFYGIFAEVLREARSLHDTPTDPATAASDTPEAQSERRWRRWAMALGALLLLGLVAVWCLGQPIQDEVRTDVRQTLALYAGQTSYLQADTLLADANAAEFLDNHRSDTLHTAKVHYRLQDSLRLLLTPLDTAGTDSITLLLRNPQGDSLRWTVVSVLRPPLTETTVDDTATVRALFAPIDSLPYPHDVFSLAITPPTPAGQLLRDYLPWIKAALLLLATALLLVLLVWRDRRRRKLVAELEQRTRPPYVWDIRFEQAAEIDFGDTLGLLLNQLRQRTAAEARELDVPATVRATVQGGGMVDFRYRQHTRPPEYLLLIDEQHHHNHRARLFNQLYARFLEEEIIISRYFYHGDPRLCFNEEHPRGIPLQDLAAKHPDTRLLLLGSGQALLSPTNGQLVRWVKLLTRWGERALLSPVPLAEWGLRESQLAELLPVLPTGLASLSFLIEQWDAGEEGEPDRWRQALGTAHTPPSIQLAEGGLLATLQAHYEPPLLHWIAACAVYPQLQYELTCQLGQLLSSPDQKLLTAENLNRLNLLPWFVAGQMPRAVRVLLLDYLEREQPALLLRVRQFLHTSLQASSPPADSAAASDHRLQMALNEWRFTEDARRKTQLEKDIAQQLRAGAEADFTVVKFLEGQRSPLDFFVSDSWKRYFSYSDYPALDWRDLCRDLLWALLILLSLLVATLWYRPDDCTGELVAYQGQTLCIETCQDQMWLLEQRALDTLRTAGLPSFEALLTELQNPDRCQGAGMDSTLNAEVRLNLSTALYNQGVALHTTQRDSACQYFAAIARLLPEGLRTTDFVRAIGWCGAGTTSPSPTPAETLSTPANMVRIPGGTFEMGDTFGEGESDEKHVHTVTVSDFYLGRYEVTFAEYDAFCTATGRAQPSDRGWGRGQCPVIYVSWLDAVAYCNWRSEQEGLTPVYTIDGDNVTATWTANGYRLPTEAEWEYAARGGGRRVRFGDGRDVADPARINFDASASYKKDYSVVGEYRERTVPVGSLNAPNALGLHDMSGNVWEWCWDWYGDYSPSAQTNPRGSNRVSRGGGWSNSPQYCRAAFRDYADPSNRSNLLGFRLARS